METLNKEGPALEERLIFAFDQKVRSNVRMNILFLTFLVVEGVLFALLIPFFLKSSLFALNSALFFLTIFGYFLLKQYRESQKNSYFEQLLEEVLADFQPESCREVEVARIFTRVAHRLYQKEYKYYVPPRFLSFLAPMMERFSAWMVWQDVHQMREMLLKKAVEEQIKLVRQEPTNPDTHAMLANAYVMLSGLYINQINDRWIPLEKDGEKMRCHFEEAAKNAIEEFKILKDYAPNDPWIYMQLAYSYRDLCMHEEEKEAYKSILMLRPHDHETRFNLGMLYFKRGENARGLKEFEELKKVNYNRADELLCLYGKGNG